MRNDITIKSASEYSTTLQSVEKVFGLLNQVTSDPDVNIKLTIDAHLMRILFSNLIAHPYVLESTCGDCEDIQNSMDKLCEQMVHKGKLTNYERSWKHADELCSETE